MTTPISPIDLNLDPSQYLQGLGQAEAGTAQFATNVRTAALAMGPFQKAMAGITPSRALLAGMGALAAGAAQVQAQMATMSAQARITNANMGTLNSGMRQLARDLPTGNAGARQITQAITSMGVAAAGSERNVAALAQVFTKLSGATGSGATELASGFIQLNRVMGTGQGAVTMEKLADSLTTVSAKAGVSAAGVLSFSKMIAPMAQSVGIGETKVLGISAAFSKLGEDGGGAATAFNKMLIDLNQSVKEGAPGLSTYASIVGKTSKQFQEMFKSDPAEAITQVTEALGKSPNAQRQLATLGLDGVRTQRYIQELSQSGGLRSAIAESTAAYGSGSTQKASEEAFKGLADASQRAAANAGQLGEALGTPLLGPLTKFTNVLGSLSTPARAVAESRVGQAGLTTAAYATVLLGVLPRLMKGLGIAQLVGSGPIRTAVAGFAAQRAGGAQAALDRGGFAARFGRSQLERMALSDAGIATPLGVGAMGHVNPYAGSFGAGIGRLAGPGGPSATPGAFGLRGIGQMLAYGPGLYANLYAEQARLARVDPAEREFRGTQRPAGSRRAWTATGRMYAEYNDRVEYARSGAAFTPSQRDAEIAAARRDLGQQMRDRRFGGLRAAGVGAGSLVGQTLTSSSALGLRGAGMLASTFGTPMMALAAGTAAYSYVHGQRTHNDDIRSQIVEGPSFVDQYRIAMGKATDATSTFAGKLTQAAGAMGTGTAKTYADVSATSVSAQQAARGFKGKSITHFTGDDKGIAAQLSRQIASGMTPDEYQRAVYDLMNQQGFTGARVQRIVGQVRHSGGGRPQDFATQMRGLTGIYQGGATGYVDRVGAGLGVADRLTGGQIQTTGEMVKSAFDTRAANLGRQGATAANKTAVDSINAALDEAIKAKRFDLAREIMKSVARESGQKYYSLSDDLLAQDRTLPKILQDQASVGGGRKTAANAILEQFSGTGGPAGGDYTSSALGTSKAGDFLTAILTGRGAGAAGTKKAAVAGQALFGPTGQAESPSAQLGFTQATLAAAQAAGMSMSELARRALAAGNALTDGTDQGKAAFAIFNAAVQQAAVNLQGLRPGQSFGQSAAINLQQAQLNPNDPTTAGLQQQGQQALQQQYQQLVANAQQRLQVQREYQVTSTRSEENYLLTRNRAYKNFGLQMERATEDYNKNVYRTQRDYQLQLARQAEDGAKVMFDPYQRMAAKGVWDARNLLGNVGEQITAMRNQITNLARLRKAGVSNATIQMLGLNDPDNAQQLARSVTDMVKDPAVVKAFNAATNTRIKLAGTLQSDPSNADFQRQKQDVAKGLADMTTDFKQTTARARTDFGIQMAQMTNDYHRLVTYAKQDLKRADEVLTSDLGKLTEALKTASTGQWVDFNSIAEDGLNDWVKLLQTFATGPYQAALKGLGFELQIVPSDRGPVDPGNAAAHTSSRDSDTAPAKTGVATLPPLVPVASTAPKTPPKPKPVPAPIIAPPYGPDEPAPQHGMLRVAVSPVEGAALQTSGSTTIVHQTVIHDSGAKIYGETTVKANTPEEYGATMTAKRRTNLTAPAVTR